MPEGEVGLGIDAEAILLRLMKSDGDLRHQPHLSKYIKHLLLEYRRALGRFPRRIFAIAIEQKPMPQPTSIGLRPARRRPRSFPGCGKARGIRLSMKSRPTKGKRADCRSDDDPIIVYLTRELR